MLLSLAILLIVCGFTSPITVPLSALDSRSFLDVVSDRRVLRASRLPEYDVFQKCKDSGEAYSASYLITREHLEHQFTAYNLTWVNCEMGSFIMMNGRANPDKNINGTLVQSVDIMDFSVIHLSTYERLLRRWAKSVASDKEARSGSIDPIYKSAAMLKARALRLRGPLMPSIHPSANKTVVVMPFLASDMGAGHSKLSNRLQYLSACFWSFYAAYPYVVAAVKSPADWHFARVLSGLPFYDVMLLEGLPKSASLPVATVQNTKERVLGGNWSHFEYMFFTESDQILMMRIPDDIYSYLDKYPRHLAIPHRLMAYPEAIIRLHHKRIPSRANPLDWMDLTCCLPRQHCTERKHWVHFSDAANLSLLNIFGMQVPLGNANFHAETYRACRLQTKSGNSSMCP